MEYVKLIGENYNDALFKAKMQYGENIIPINHKDIKIDGFLGSRIFGKNATELLAAIPERTRLRDNGDAGSKLRTSFDKENKGSLGRIPESLDSKSVFALKTLLNKKREIDLKSEKWRESLKLNGKENQNTETVSGSLSPVSVLKKKDSSENNFNLYEDDGTGLENFSINKIQKSLSEIHSVINGLGLDKKNSNGKKFYHAPLDYWENKLINSDFSPEYTKDILDELKENLSLQELKERSEVEKQLLVSLKNRIGVAPPIMTPGEKQKVAMFIGATGVGKTTTLAKLGAMYTFYENRKVSFITIDNYRIAATEQLKRYASIINIPTHAVNQAEELEKIIKNEESELILIDTSGRGPYNQVHINDCLAMLEGLSMPVEKILVTQATLKRSDQDIIMQNFEKIGIDKVILTKIDETFAIGGFFEIADKYNKGISYVTFGQDVPTDIELADSAKLAKRILMDYSLDKESSSLETVSRVAFS